MGGIEGLLLGFQIAITPFNLLMAVVGIVLGTIIGVLHGLGGATPIQSVVPAGEHQAHNLVVDEENTYFVGKGGLLVHDNEFRKPTRAIVPGLVRD